MASRNMSWVRYPSRVSPAVEEVIAAQSVLARALQAYAALCLPLALGAGLFNLVVLLRGRAWRGGLDACLLDLTATELLTALLSLTALNRPGYLDATRLGCAALSFLGNLAGLNTQLLSAALLFLFLPPGPARWLPLAGRAARRPAAWLAAIGAYALAGSLTLAPLLGAAGELHAVTLCQLDPLTAWPEYEFAKLGLGPCLGLGLELVFCGLLVVRRVRGKPPPRAEPACARRVLPALALVVPACRLPYGIALLARGLRKLRGGLGSPRDELLLNLAELLLFAEACLCALAVLLLHAPCTHALRQLAARLPCPCLRPCLREDPGGAVALGNREDLGQSPGPGDAQQPRDMDTGHSL